MEIQAVINATIDNLYFYLNIPEVSISNTTIIQDHVGMYDRDYSMFL